MTTVAQLRKASLGLPETEEVTEAGRVAFAVRGAVFASVSEDGRVELAMADPDADRALARIATAERATRDGAPIGLRVALGDVDGMVLNGLVHQAWLHRAPEPLAAAQRRADRGEAPDGPDALPKAIGKPATRALLGAGVRSLRDLTAWSEAELLARHGVGPKAVRLLGEALAERGLSFRSEPG